MTLDLIDHFSSWRCGISYMLHLFVAKGREWALLVGSMVAIYWLQPNLAIRFSSYILQTVTVLLTVAIWWLTRFGDNDEIQQRETVENRITLLIILLLIVGMAFNRYLNADIRLLNFRPPPPLTVGAALGLIVILSLVVGKWLNRWDKRRVLSVAIIIIVVVFIILKTEPITIQFASFWRRLTGQDSSLASIE